MNFFPNSESVIVEEDKGRNERVRLFKVNISEPEKMKPLTMEDPPFFLRGGSIHPNERWLVFGANYDFIKKEEIEPTWVYRQDLNSGEKIILAKPNKPNWLYPELSKTGDHILYNRKEYHPKGTQYWIADIEGKKDQELLYCRE